MFIDKTITEAATTEDICCPLFDQSKWDNVQHEWKDKLFLKDSVPEVFHIPLPGIYKKVITKMWSKAKDAGAAPELNDFFILAHDPSAFKGELYMAITREVPEGENIKLSGKFFSKVFEAYYNEVPRCIREMNEFLASNKLVSKKDYIYFPYCPKYAKKYGKNYVVVLSETKPR